jgi:hypothetical protein
VCVCVCVEVNVLYGTCISRWASRVLIVAQRIFHAYVYRLVDYQHKTTSARHRRQKLQRFLLCSPRTCRKCGKIFNAASCSAFFPSGSLQPRSQGSKSERMRIHTLHAYARLQLRLTNMPHPCLPSIPCRSLHANLYPRFHPVPTPEKATGLHVATQGASGDVHGGNIVGYVGRNSGSSSDTRPKTVSVRHGTQAAGDEARFKASSTGRGSRSGSRCGAPHVVSTDYDLKSAEKRAKGVEYTGRETMSKQAKMNALLALYQQRHLPAMSTKLTSDLL